MVILTLDHSYEQARANNKMIRQIAGQGKIELTEEMRAKVLTKEIKEELVTGLTSDVHSERVTFCSTISAGGCI